MASCLLISKKIVELNDNAIFYISQGNHRAATRSLNIALTQIKLLLEHSAPNSMQENMQSEIRPIGHNDTSYRTKRSDDRNIPFFNRAFRMSNIISAGDQDRCTVVLLFNLALVHHDRGIESGSCKDLFIALNYYKLALRMIHEAGNSIGPESMLLLTLALWNNMANIHSYSCNISEARRCLKWLKALIECDDSCVLEDDDYVFFSVNLLINPEEQMTGAPAA